MQFKILRRLARSMPGHVSITPFHPPILGYLEQVSRTRSCAGLYALAGIPGASPYRSVQRWRERLGKQLRYFPTFYVEAFGLVHLHVLIANVSSSFVGFRWAVEHAWGTDLEARVLYVHCIVPVTLESAVREELERACTAGSLLIVRSMTGTQGLNLTGHANGIALPPFRLTQGEDQTLFDETPLLVPVVLESWNARLQLRELWNAITHRIQDQLGTYLPRTGFLNGPAIMNRCLQRLASLGLFNQFFVRHDGLRARYTEVLLVVCATPRQYDSVLGAFAQAAVVIETYPAPPDHLIVRVTGGLAVFEALAALPLPYRGVVLDPPRNADVVSRVAYEKLFDPRSRSWRGAG